MPFVFLLLGLALLIVAVKGTHVQLFTLLKSEFTGSNNFLVWIAAIAILGALGFIKPIRPIALGMIVLVVLVMVLKNKGGFFASFNQQIRNPVLPPSDASASVGTGGSVTGPAGTPSGPSLFTAPEYTATPPSAMPATTLFPWMTPQQYLQFDPTYQPAA